MMTEHSSTTSLRGGAYIGGIMAPWPLARVEVSAQAATVDFLGQYRFAPAEVLAIESVGTLPLLTTGIRIHHHRPDYPEMFVVYCSPRARTVLLQALRAAGFTTGHPAIPTPARGFPVRTKALVAALLGWNLMFVMGKLPSGIDGNPVHSELEQAFYALIAPVLVLLVASLAPRSRRIQRFLLRTGRQLGEIRGALKVLQAIAAIALAVEATQLLAQ
jgi:hypothetical protein